jgi:post-segregation antitoxin (ccd killing protein)
MAAMNVYVPPDLRQRMRQFDSKVNWSRVAAAAFEREVEAQERLRKSEAAFVGSLVDVYRRCQRLA